MKKSATKEIEDRARALKAAFASPLRSPIAAFAFPFSGTLLVAGAVWVVVAGLSTEKTPASAGAEATIRCESPTDATACDSSQFVFDRSNVRFVETTAFASFEIDDKTDLSKAEDSLEELDKNSVETVANRRQASERAERSASSNAVLNAADDARQNLAQFEFQLKTLRRSDAAFDDQFNAELAALWENVEQLARRSENDADVAEKARSLLSQIQDFQSFINEGKIFFKELEQFDDASVDANETRRFLERFAAEPAESTSESPEIAERRRDLAAVATTLDALDAVDDWNAFVAENGATLERFYVAPDRAERALRFLSQNESRQGVPLELAALKRRAPEWRFAVANRVATRRKIILALTAELEARSNESAQRLFLQELIESAQNVPDALRADDVGRWYSEWSAFLNRLQTTRILDPIAQFHLLKKTAEILTASDYYFSRRLAPILRVLNVPESENAPDRAESRDERTRRLRRLAQTRVAFLPSPDDYLKVDKTTQNLDAQVEKFAFEYRRVGRLSQDFSGTWRLRGPKDFTVPVGDLYILRAEEKSVASDVAPRFHWLKIGTSDGRRTTIQFAAPNIWRGSVVFCRTRPNAEKELAEKAELGNRVFLRR